MSAPTDISALPEPKRPSDTREHLANERTFLAWVRTSLALIGLGFAVAKFGDWLQQSDGPSEGLAESSRSSTSFVVGILMIGAGGALAIMAARRHRTVARQIHQGDVQPAGATVTVVAILILVVAVALGGLAFSGAP